jgi:hypothetical protein
MFGLAHFILSVPWQIAAIVGNFPQRVKRLEQNLPDWFNRKKRSQKAPLT